VTRHLATELSAEDWRLMILHYLGLDHIGHVEGPQSPHVRPKLQEMDAVVKRIHHSFSAWVRQKKYEGNYLRLNWRLIHASTICTDSSYVRRLNEKCQLEIELSIIS
jgi:predicted AlkP superfamily pyrophosphatase or phosphodiesterase